jgi:phage head maturation protease
MSDQRLEIELKAVEVARRKGVLLGYAIVTKYKNADGRHEEYWDLQGDHIPDDAMFDAALEFARTDRKALVQHKGNVVGSIDFIFPLTEDAAKALGVQADRYGLLVGMRPDDPEQLMKMFDVGDVTGFSIGYWAEEVGYV